MTDDLAYTHSVGVSGFGQHRDEDEYYHRTGAEGDSLTETWYWGFSVPEQRINCYAYCWAHPNLGVASVGLMIYRGIKEHHLEAELFDMPMFLSDAVLGDGGDIHCDNGFRVQVISPLKELHLTYADPGRETALDVYLTAHAEPVMRANNQHFEQPMRVTGELTLRGERHHVDCISIRDRSWGQLRPEAHNPSAPMTWTTGATQDGALAFTVNAFDGPAPEALLDGWMIRDGRRVRIEQLVKTTERDARSLRPRSHLLEGVDADGRDFRISGEVIAGLPWSGWHNARCHLGLVKWETESGAAFGETIDVQWNDYIWRTASDR